MARTTFSGPVASDNGFLSTVTNTSTGSSTYEVSVTDVTMTGAGGVGGRTRFQLNADAALGSFSNALKAQVVYGTSGKTTGLGSAFVAEMTLSAGTDAGTYAPLEIELNAPDSASTGTLTSFIHISTQGANVATVDDNARLFNLAGVTAGSGHIFQTGDTAANVAGSLKVRVDGTDYYVVLYDGQVTTS
jgi:hypothetical protein